MLESLGIDAGIAQSVEQLIRNQQVVCSSHIASSRRRRKVRSTAFPGDSLRLSPENFVRSLASPPKTEPAALGFGFVFTGVFAKSARLRFRGIA